MMTRREMKLGLLFAFIISFVIGFNFWDSIFVSKSPTPQPSTEEVAARKAELAAAVQETILVAWDNRLGVVLNNKNGEMLHLRGLTGGWVAYDEYVWSLAPKVKMVIPPSHPRHNAYKQLVFDQLVGKEPTTLPAQ